MDLKHNLRKKIIRERKLLSGYELQSENEAILENINIVLQSLDKKLNNDALKIVKLQATEVEFINASKGIGSYLPFKGEPDLTKLILYHTNWVFGLPKLEGDKMKFVHYKIGAPLENIALSTLASGRAETEFEKRSIVKGFLQPSSNIEMLPHIIIAPGLAYSVKGYRLGFGNGYYDKYLSDKKATSVVAKIGVCFDKYLLEYVPHQNHDVKFDYIITDKIILKL